MKTAGEMQNLSRHPSVQRLKEVLTRGILKPIWWEIPGGAPKALDYAEARKSCHFVRESAANRRTCQTRFLKALEEAGGRRQAVTFVCPIQRYAVAIPAFHNGQTIGFLGLCHSEQAIPQANVQLAHLTVASTQRELERDQELKNLSEAIQPRCIALSTIHTIHRLISSTLDLEELLPRVARLCCQVLRAQVCAIWLIDRHKRVLVPRAVVGLALRRQRSVRPCRLGLGPVGKVALRCQAIVKPRLMIIPLVEEDCLGVILVQRSGQVPDFGSLDQEILTTLAEQAVIAIGNAQMYEAQERITWGTIKSMSAILDGMGAHPSRARSHSRLMSKVALEIARKLKAPPSIERPLQYAALLHDAGRLGIPESILRKPSKLEPSEYAQIQQHQIKGVRFLEPLEILEPALPIILYHHERFDGTGYPKGLKREMIPLGARILGLANAFEAMVSERPYRKAMSVEKATQEIASHAGTQFDPKVVEAFLALGSQRLKELVREEEAS